jgi:hypothetical protein
MQGPLGMVHGVGPRHAVAARAEAGISPLAAQLVLPPSALVCRPHAGFTPFFQETVPQELSHPTRAGKEVLMVWRKAA